MGSEEQNYACTEPGQHICLAYLSQQERIRALTAFFRAGFVRHERCFYTAPRAQLEDLVKALAASGDPVDRLVATGALVLVPAQEIYFPRGRFDPQQSAQLVAQAVLSARDQGWSRFRGAGEVDWTYDQGQHQTELAVYENQLTVILAEAGAVGLCLYDHRKAHPRTVHRALRTHPQAVLAGRLCENPFFEPAPDGSAAGELARPGKAPPSLTAEATKEGDQRVGWMIDTVMACHDREAQVTALRDALQTEAESLARHNNALLEERAQLRQAIDMRDDLLGMTARQLNPPLGILRRLLADVQKQCADLRLHEPLEILREQVQAAGETAARLGAVAEFASAPPQLKPTPLDFSQLVQRVYAHLQSLATWDRTEVRFETPVDLWGEWDAEQLPEVVTSLLCVAHDRGWGTRIDVAIEERGSLARLTVRYRGMETDPAFQSAATDFGQLGLANDHDRLGLALWIPHELVARMGGTLGVCRWPDGRVTLTLDLPRQPPGATPDSPERTAGTRPG